MTFFHRNDDRDYDNKTVSNDDDNDMVAVAVTLLTTTTTTTRALPLDNFILQFCTKLPVGSCVWWWYVLCTVPILKVNNLQCEKQERRSVAIKHNNVFSDRQTKRLFNSTQLND